MCNKSCLLNPAPELTLKQIHSPVCVYVCVFACVATYKDTHNSSLTYTKMDVEESVSSWLLMSVLLATLRSYKWS